MMGTILKEKGNYYFRGVSKNLVSKGSHKFSESGLKTLDHMLEKQGMRNMVAMSLNFVRKMRMQDLYIFVEVLLLESMEK